MAVAVVILAAGSGTRVGAGINKALLPLADSTVAGLSLRAALASNATRVVLVHAAGEAEALGAAVINELGDREVALVQGGATRHASEREALRLLRPAIESGEITVVSIHDAARPLASPELFNLTAGLAAEFGGAIPASPVTNVITQGTWQLQRGTAAVQTPQAFQAAPLLAAYDAAAADGFEGTDTAATLAQYSELTIAAVPSSPLNLKVTFAEDVATVNSLLEQ